MEASLPSRSRLQSKFCQRASYLGDSPPNHLGSDWTLRQAWHTSTRVSLTSFSPSAPLADAGAPAIGALLPSLYEAGRVSSFPRAREKIECKDIEE